MEHQEPDIGARSSRTACRKSALLFSGEHSVQGKAGALWETAFPLLHPLPSPRSTPSFSARHSPHSDSARLLGKAGRLGSGRLVFPLVARATRTDSQRVPTQAALVRGAFFGRYVSGGRALESYVLEWRVLLKPSRLRIPRSDAHLWAQFYNRWELFEALPPETKRLAKRR